MAWGSLGEAWDNPVGALGIPAEASGIPGVAWGSLGEAWDNPVGALGIPAEAWDNPAVDSQEAPGHTRVATDNLVDIQEAVAAAGKR